jgi:hypothetical protein
MVFAGQPLCGALVRLAPEGRPRIGLALGGGSARGLAHVGVLEWMEEHRIPVDLIAGTSIGGLIGGGYATGCSAAEVRALIETIDWDVMFRGEVDYALKSFRRKEDRRDFPVRLDIGLRGGLRLAPGLDPGHEIELFLSRLALPYAAPLCFDDLPTPFRAVATDLEAAAVEVLDDAPSPFYQFTLGGPFRLGAFDVDEFRGPHTAYVAAGYVHRIGRLPDLVGGPIHLVAWFESGSAFETPREAVVHSDLSGGLLVDTLMGALLVSGSVGDDGSGAFYVALGRPFW